MDVKIVLLYVEAPILVLLIIEIVAACILHFKGRKAEQTADYAAEDASENQPPVSAPMASAPMTGAPVTAPAQPAAPREPEGYVQGADRFLDTLNASERAEFYRFFINNSRSGLHYNVGQNNTEFFSGAFINLSSVRFVVSENLMHKICMEYDRLSCMPVTER